MSASQVLGGPGSGPVVSTTRSAIANLAAPYYAGDLVLAAGGAGSIVGFACPFAVSDSTIAVATAGAPTLAPLYITKTIGPAFPGVGAIVLNTANAADAGTAVNLVVYPAASLF
jgi:hypothetical protein